ncbi:alpha/beta hydrolase [Sphingorhabdus arenilitoris]|uniref:Palmitoyl-protein thioesterase ABHD10, mitochondrial n=1 Tax=Sphingorhabdus arenilitoris TaxID=1490041 RepID=A0ABV8RI11_9SPHN
MDQAPSPPDFVTRADGVRLAYRYSPGDGPAILFLPGYMSDMQGGKAQAVEAWARANGRAMLRLDYSGCGESGGDFADGSFTVWRDDVVTILAAVVTGPVLLIGSSMGGWLMLLLALALGDRVTGMIGIAAAPDFTNWGYSEAQKRTLLEQGVVYEDNPYGPEPTPTYRKLFEDGQSQLMLGATIAIDCPVRLLHGQCDADVPFDISLQLAAALRSSDVQIMLVKDGDHRLSRDQDIDLLLNILSQMPA